MEAPPGARAPLAELGRQMLEHLRTYLEGDGEEAHLWDSTGVGGPGPVPTLLLTTQGRRSGDTRHSPLIYGRRGDDFVVVASRGGSPTHPGWYHNLCAEPVVTVKVARDAFRARARTAPDRERDELWKIMCEVYPPYDAYQAHTERKIPVVVLERIED